MPNLASGLLQRTSGLPLHVPAVGVWSGSLTDSALPEPGSAWVQWDPMRGPSGVGLKMPDADNGAHIAMRWMPEFQAMVAQFLLGDGAIDPRACITSGRDSDGKLPCDLTESIPAKEGDMKPDIGWWKTH